MGAPPQDVEHLVALIGAARAHAERIGPPARGVTEVLEQAMTAARALLGQGGQADEGIRPADLTTDNDK